MLENSGVGVFRHTTIRHSEFSRSQKLTPVDKLDSFTATKTLWA